MVTSRFSGEFFGAVEALLSPSDGVLVMEAITVPEVTQRHVMCHAIYRVVSSDGVVLSSWRPSPCHMPEVTVATTSSHNTTGAARTSSSPPPRHRRYDAAMTPP